MKSRRKFALMGSIAITALTTPTFAQADQISQLQAEISALSVKLSQIEAHQAKAEHEEHIRVLHAREEAHVMQERQNHDELLIKARNAVAQTMEQKESPTRAQQEGLVNNQYVTKGALPGSFVIPGTDTSIRVSGFINFQAEYSPTQNLGPKFSIGNLLPPSPSRRSTAGDFQFQSKVSRLIVQSSTPSEFGPVTTNFALDFYGYVAGGDYNQALQNNSYSARVVYAYGTIGPLTLGMLNSNFIDATDTPETFDNGGPAGIPAERTEQIRLTFPFGKGSIVSVAAENPQSGYQDTRGNIEVASVTEPMPDFSLRYQYTNKLLHLQLGGVLRDIAYTDGAGNRTSHLTGAGLAGITVNLGAINESFSQDNIGAQVWAGAIGRYIPDDFGGNVASVLAVNNGTTGTPVTIATKIQDDQGFTAWIQHYWTAKLRSTFAIGYNRSNIASFLPINVANAVATKTAHLNLIYRPVPSVDLGIEGMIGQKQFQKGTGVSPKNAERIEFGGIWHF